MLVGPVGSAAFNHVIIEFPYEKPEDLRSLTNWLDRNQQRISELVIVCHFENNVLEL